MPWPEYMEKEIVSNPVYYLGIYNNNSNGS